MIRDDYKTKFVPREQYEIVRRALQELIDVTGDQHNRMLALIELRKAEAMEI